MPDSTKDKRLHLFDDAGVEALVIPHREQAYSEDEVLAILTQQVAYLLDNRRDWFLGKLYRLDVRSGDIQRVLHGRSADVSKGLAHLILLRQGERAHTWNEFKSPPLTDEEREEFGDW